MLSNVGNIQKAELTDDGDEAEWKRGIVTYELKEGAQAAIDKFHESTFEVNTFRFYNFTANIAHFVSKTFVSRYT